MTAVITARGVGHRYGARIALHDVDLDLPVGVTALLGPNGAGKSTFLGLAATALRIRQGSIEIDGIDSRRQPRDYRRLFGFLPQQFSVPRHLTVREFLTLAAWWRLVPRGQRSAAVETALADTDLTSRADTKLGGLSGGMWRRVGIAQAVIGSPRVVFLDEPTVGLDPRQRTGLRRIVTRLGAEHSVVLSTHLTEDVAAVADRVVVLDEGQVVFTGSTTQLARTDQPDGRSLEHAYAELLGAGEAG